MKKIILLFAVICASASLAIAQGQGVRVTNNAAATDQYTPSNAPVPVINKQRGVGDPFPSTIGTKFVVGKTTYDLQTNGSLQNRLMVDGSNIHAAWTMSLEGNATSTSAYTDRGTGYAFYNGTAWGAAPTGRLEQSPSTRTGFGAMGINGNGNPIYVTHSAAYNIILNEKTGSGWTTTQTALTNANSAIWPDVATSDDWMYVICGSQDSNTKSNGIRYGYFFSRSNDNGATWIDNMIPMPLIDSVTNSRGGGNSYSISARDSVVAIVFGDYGTDLTMLRSNDYGSTWTKRVIYDWPLDNYTIGTITDTNADLIADTLFVLDGGLNLALDKNGEEHVAFGSYQMWNDGTGGFYRPLTSCMFYYNSITDSYRKVDDIFAVHHRGCDGDSTSFQNPAVYGNEDPPTGQAQYNTGSFITQPQVSVNDGNDDVYITYTSIIDGAQTVADIFNPAWFGVSGKEFQPYRDVLVLASNDKGASFGYPVNISRTRHYEEAFPSVPEVIMGNDLHVLYQGDIEPGTIMTNEDVYDPEFENWMIYQNVSIADIFTESANIGAPCAQFELPLAVNEVALENGTVKMYPNPAADFITVELALNNVAKQVSYELYDLTGRMITQINSNNVTNDKVQINVQSLSTGNYILKVNADNAVSSHKVSVK